MRQQRAELKVISEGPPGPSLFSATSWLRGTALRVAAGFLFRGCWLVGDAFHAISEPCRHKPCCNLFTHLPAMQRRRRGDRARGQLISSQPAGGKLKRPSKSHILGMQRPTTQ